MQQSQEIQIELENDTLSGDLTVPDQPQAVILFAHGSGSSRLSPRNKFVATQLNKGGFATLLLDLLSQGEDAADEHMGKYRFDIPLLARRLQLAINWLNENHEVRSLPLGLFGASTGSAAAIIAAANSGDRVAAVVSRGGRPDLAGEYLPLLEAPTLLIVGGADIPVITLNEEAMSQMRCLHRITIIPGATHLFEEPGALERVAHLANSWFVEYLAPKVQLS